MAAPVYTSDLTDIYAGAGSTTNWTALGGGASGLNAETDYFIQGTGCTSKNAFANSTRGMIYDNGAGVTIPTDGAVLLWQTHQTANSLDLQSNGGWQTLIGSATNAYKHYYVAGSDTIVYDDRWRCIPINPTITQSNTTGSPTTTVQTFGILNTMVGGPTKGAPQASDAIRYGRVQYDYTGGDLGNGYATFLGAASYNDNINRRYGQLQLSKGTYFMQGLHNLGTTSTAVDFRDSNKTINIINTEFVTSGFNSIVVNNAASNVQISGISISALGTVSRGSFIINNNAIVSVSACTFADMGNFSLGGSNTIITGTSFNRCNTITINSSTVSECIFSNSTATSSTITTNLADLDNCTFISDGSNHATELTSVGGGSMDWSCVTIGYVAGTSGNNVSSSSTGNETIFLNFTSSATFTINVATGATVPSIRKSAGMTGNVNVIAGAVSITVLAAETDGTPIIGARVFVEAGTTGNLPSEDSVTITRSGTTATVSHTAHTLSNGDKVVIRGADQNEYNGIQTISNVTTNTYDYTVSGTPATPATGTILSSFVFISDVTDSNGEASSPPRTLTANQSITGRVRKGSTSPYYKTGQVVGTATTASGLSTTVIMILDE